MTRLRTGSRLGLVGVALFAAGFHVRSQITSTEAAYSGTTGNAANSFAAAADWVAPSGSPVAIGKTAGGATGAIKSLATYYVYANVTDAGNPASGTATVTADVSAITAGQTAAAMTSGSYTANGVSYNYRSASLTAGSYADMSKSFTLTLTDANTPTANSQTQSGFSVNIDGTAPTATDVQPVNGGATVGKAEAGDTITYTFSEPIDPNSVLAGWTGTSTAVTLRVGNSASNDIVTVRNAANTAALTLGGTTLAGNHVSANRDFTSSTMVMSGSTITVTLGGTGTTNTVATNQTATWTPLNTAADVAANAMSTTARTEQGAADPNF